MLSNRYVLAAIGSLLTLGYAQDSFNSTITKSASTSASSKALSASTYSESYAPTGTPLPGNYNERLRPQVHYSPPVGFMNDPNGMFVDEKGIYHLYYQCM
jgi:beta-fructofuranosidase